LVAGSAVSGAYLSGFHEVWKAEGTPIGGALTATAYLRGDPPISRLGINEIDPSPVGGNLRCGKLRARLVA
jgi:hypothetical protein